ncbi:MAG: right-handed parallel beta-helix repeat-containing protein, partial [Thermoplasmata archaeon]|nr:right-handed parallel beta-helix repeat-containing protein [Thermoplasmata archaeon]
TFALLALVLSGSALAQTNPPALGDGDWTVTDTTVIRDWGGIMLRGDLKVTDGGDLTLSNSTMLFVNSEAGEHGLVVDNGGSIHIIEGSTVGSSRPNVAWTFVVEDGCTLEIRDSSIEECGKPSFGFRPNWKELALYVGTSDAVVEDTSFLGGLAGLYFAEGVIASPVRNCTFENAYGIVSWGTAVEDCTFHDQTLYGVVFHGGTEGRIVRSTFDGVFATCVQVGFEYFEPSYELFTAQAIIEDCTFVNSVRAIRVLTGSTASISDCTIDGMEREGIVAWEGAIVHLLDGNIMNSTNAILCSDGAWMDWDVTGHSRVLRGNVTLAGNISLSDRAILDLIDIRNLTMLSHEGDPLTIGLGTGAALRMDRGSIEIPPETTSPHDWAPVGLHGLSASVELSQVSVLNLSFPIELQVLLASNTTIPLGRWILGRTELVDCELFVDPLVNSPSITITSSWAHERSIMRRCSMKGAEMDGPWSSPWLVIEEGIVHSYDFLHDIEDLLDNGAIEMTYGSNDSKLLILWSWQAHVHWQNQMPIGGTVVLVRNSVPIEYTGTTGPDGYVRE